ncbi:MAG TPA: hypothetical protein VFN11_01020 [Ktedonobacterales bacterium]|jgi:hypothetical protein|nr:hypothetical protein [Ktedonobacterales bacterium]
MRNLKTGQNDIIRLIALGVLVVLEGFAMVSTVLNVVFLPLGVVYPNVASVSILILPIIIGLVAHRLEVAIVLTVLPFLVLAVVYTTIYAPVWNVDLFQLGVQAGRVAGAGFLLGGLGAFGNLLRRIFLSKSPSQASES